MSNFDVRDVNETTITQLTFADPDSEQGSTQAYFLSSNDFLSNTTERLIKIEDDQEDFVYLSSEQHAKDLIKALEKAIELKWFSK